jgi:hypothetical protein
MCFTTGLLKRLLSCISAIHRETHPGYPSCFIACQKYRGTNEILRHANAAERVKGSNLVLIELFDCIDENCGLGIYSADKQWVGQKAVATY